MLQFPLFDQNTIPMMVKVLLTVGFSFAIFPLLQNVVVRDVVLVGAENIWVLTIFYTIMGLMVGFLSKSILFLFNSVKLLSLNKLVSPQFDILIQIQGIK